MVEKEMNYEGKKNSKNLRQKMKSRKKKLMKKYKERFAAPEDSVHSDTYEYLVRMVDVVENVKNDLYEMEVLASNVFGEIKGNELYFSKIGITSKLLEELLPYAKDNDFDNFVVPFIDNMRPIFTARVASHILELIVEELLKRYMKKIKGDEKLCVQYSDTIIKVAHFALNNIESFIWEPSSNHVLRTIINVLRGASSKGEVIDEVDKEILPSEFNSTLEKFVQSLINSSQLSEFFCNTLTSGLIQTLLISTKHLVTVNKAIVKKIIRHYKHNSPDLNNKINEPLLRLIEASMEVAREKEFEKIFKKCFKNNIKELSISSANFAIQKLIKNCDQKVLFEEIFNELSEFGEKIYESRNYGVLYELAQGCLTHKSNQGGYVKMIMRILKCKNTMNEDSDITPLTCCMVTSDNYNPEEMKINLHGTLIIQAMLNFSKPIKVINSLLNMDEISFLKVISDVKGCHIIDAFMKSQSVGEKSRDRLFKKLTGNFIKLATGKHGSRALDAIWNTATFKNRLILMEEFKKNESELVSNPFGKIFYHKTHLPVYRMNKEDWIKRERTLETTKRCFSDIIPAKKAKLCM